MKNITPTFTSIIILNAMIGSSFAATQKYYLPIDEFIRLNKSNADQKISQNQMHHCLYAKYDKPAPQENITRQSHYSDLYFKSD